MTTGHRPAGDATPTTAATRALHPEGDRTTPANHDATAAAPQDRDATTTLRPRGTATAIRPEGDTAAAGDTTAAVIVPTFNRPERLRACLEALVRLDGPAPEIVVVDDGSPTPLGPVVEPFGARIRYIRQANRGPAAARNAGVRATAAAFVAFTDDDCRPRPDWLLALARARGGDPARLVGGRVENALADNVYAAASQSLCDFLYGWFDAEAGEAPFFTSNNMGCDRATFERLGGFDETFPLAAAEDRDFGIRWRAAGGSLHYAPGAVVDHSHALDLPRFWRQHRNYGRGARHLHRQLDTRGDTRPKREALAFYAGLVAHPLRAPGRHRLAQAGLMALSQAAMVQGYLTEIWSERPGHPRKGQR